MNRPRTDSTPGRSTPKGPALGSGTLAVRVEGPRLAEFGCEVPPGLNVAPGESVTLHVVVEGRGYHVPLTCKAFDPATRWGVFTVEADHATPLSILFGLPLGD